MIGHEFFVELTQALETHALRTGYFDRVNKSEPKRAPDYGITAAIWPQTLLPVGPVSGLASSSGIATYVIRIYQPMLQEPIDQIEISAMRATAALIAALTADFQLTDAGGKGEPLVMHIDLLGAYGPGLSAVAGYLDLDRTKYRVMDIAVPMVIADAFEQEN